MAVLSGTQQSSSVTESIPAEEIETSLQLAPLPPQTGLAIAWLGVIGPGKGATANLLLEETESVPAGGVTEGDEFVLVEATLAERTVTPLMVGYARLITDQSRHDSTLDIVNVTGAKAVRFLGNRIDVDLLALITSLTAIETHTGVAMVDDYVQNTIARVHAQNKGEQRFALIMNHIQFRDWNKDLRSNGGAFNGGDAQSQAIAKMLGPTTGYKGEYAGMSVFVSTNVPMSTNDAVGAIVPMGPGGPLALRSWQPLEVEQERVSLRKSTQVVYSVRYGVAVANLVNGVRLLTNGT